MSFTKLAKWQIGKLATKLCTYSAIYKSCRDFQKRNENRDVNCRWRCMYRVTHSGFTTFRGLEMWLKWCAHNKTRQHHFQKDPPFTLNHQLRSADPFPVVKIDLKSTGLFFFFFCYFYQSNVFFKSFYIDQRWNNAYFLRNLCFRIPTNFEKSPHQWISR